MMSYTFITIVLLVIRCSDALNEAYDLRTNGFRVETDSRCDGVETDLTWKIGCSKVQSAYEIEVRNLTHHVKWSSGKVETNETRTSYRGDSLRSDEIVSWRVRTWCENMSEPSPWSSSLTFRGARCAESDWTGKWITYSQNHESNCPASTNPIFEKTFQVTKNSTGKVYVAGLGYFRVSLNGVDISNGSFLDPPLTTFSKRVSYAVYDVALRAGKNTISVQLGSGWFNLTPMKFWGSKIIRDNLTSGQPQMRLDLVKNDSTLVVSSDDTWTYRDGPYVFNDVYLGTKFDARLLNNSVYRPVSIVQSNLFPLRPYTVPPIRVFETLEAHLVPGTDAVFDFGRNFAGTVRYQFRGPLEAGQIFVFRYGEVLWPNKTVNGLTSVAGQIKSGNGGECAPTIAFQEDVFISDKLEADETFEYIPRFTWHGFRFVQIINGTSIASAQGLALRTDVDRAVSVFNVKSGEDEHRLTKLFNLVRNTFSSNMFSVQSDCPHRERFGYGGDLLATYTGGSVLYQMHNFYRKRVVDYVDAQRPLGGYVVEHHSFLLTFIRVTHNKKKQVYRNIAFCWD